MTTLRTYHAILRGDHVEWTGDKPASLSDDRELSVQITVHPLDEALPLDWRERQRLAFAALQRIADRGGIPSIPDPVAWQREIRQDRPLSGREP
jgi:hypothetical protein